MKKIGINTVFNIIAKLWSIVSVYLFIPAYIRILGEETYGLVSFFATLQMAMNLLGLGLSNTLRREFASGDQSEINRERKYKLLRSVENIYFIIAIIITLICFLGSNFISNKWLNIENLNSDMVSNVISLMGISIAIQVIANLYSGCLFGLDHQVMANVYNIVWSVFKSVGSLLIISFISKNLEHFYLWHILVDIIYVFIMRITIAKKLGSYKFEKWKFSDINNLKSIWKYTVGILIISIVSLVNRQLDKVIISNSLSVTELGAYNIATTLGSLTAIIPSAISNSVFPKFTNKVTSGDTSVKQDFKTVDKITSVCISCIGSYIAAFALPLIKIWTHSEVYIDKLGIVASLVVVAVTLIEYQEISYTFALANGNTKINVIIGLAFIPFVSVFTFFGIRFWGLIGAGVVYLVMMMLQTVIYLIVVYRLYSGDNVLLSLFTNLVLPILFSALFAIISYFVINSITKNTIIICCLAIVFGFVTLIVETLVFLKNDIYKIMKKI